MRNFSTHNMQKNACQNFLIVFEKNAKNTFGHVADHAPPNNRTLA